MIRCALAVCADSVIVDKASLNTSVINILEQINAEGFPVAVRRVFGYFHMTREAEDPPQLLGDVTFRLNGTEIFRGPCRIDFQAGLRSRAIVQINGLVIPGPGILIAALSIDGEEKGRWEMYCEGRPAQLRMELENGGQLPT